MFGCPALYVERKMALSVYEDSIGMRVPEAVALAAKAAGRASPFTPYGKKPMRERIAVDALDALPEFRDLFDAAL
jgi:TfoX/Sxy family transcriptional regulator of competence genes